MNLTVIADSSALFSLLITTDTNHAEANKISIELVRQEGVLLIPGEIFSEVINILGKKVSKDQALKAGYKFTESEVFMVLETTASIRSRALTLYKKQPASVSFTDCLVMAFADEYKTQLVFGFDIAFRKNGYVRLGLDDQKR